MTDRKAEKLLLSEVEDIVSSSKERILSDCGVKAKGGVSWKPVLSVAFAAAFIIAFAVICYIPVYYRNHGITPIDTPEVSGSESVEHTFETMPEAAEGVPFETIKGGSAEGLVVLYTNGETHYPYADLSYRCTRGADGKNEREDHGTVPRANDGYYTYGPDLNFRNNVIDREMTVFTVCVRQSSDDLGNGVGSIEHLKEYLNNAVDGYYVVEIGVSWDDIDLKNEGEYFDVYSVRFVLRVEEHDLFKTVKTFDLDNIEKSDELKFALPLDYEKHYENVRQYECGSEETLGFGIYSYFDENQKEQVCLVDKKGALMFDSDTDADANSVYRIIYAEGKTGPVLFYVESADIKYEGQRCSKYTVYAYDLTKHKKDTLAEIGPFAYSSGLWDMTAGISYYEGSHDIMVGVSGTDHSRTGPAVINFNKQIRIVFNNGKYELAENAGTETPSDTVIQGGETDTVVTGTLCIRDGMSEYIPENAALPQYAESDLMNADMITKAYTALAEEYPEFTNYPRHMMSVCLTYRSGDDEKPDIAFDFNVGAVKTGTEYIYGQNGATEKKSSAFDGLYDIYLTTDRCSSLRKQLLHDLALKLRTNPEDLLDDDVVYSWEEKNGEICLTVSYTADTADGYKEYSVNEPVYNISALQELKETAKAAERKKLSASILDDHFDNKYEKYDSVSTAVKELYRTAYGLCMNDDVLLYKTQSEFANGSFRRFLTNDRDAQHIYLNGIIYNSPKNKKSDTSINDIFLRLIYCCLENSYIYTQYPSSPERDIIYPDYLRISFEKNGDKGEAIVISIMHGSIYDVSLYPYNDDSQYIKTDGFFDEMKKEAKQYCEQAENG